jgi:hypothetical protein
MIDMTSFDAESAYKQAKAIAYPRLVGTQGEKQAAGHIKQQLEQFGYRVTGEGFNIRYTPWGFNRLCLLFALILLLISWLTYESHPVVALCLLLILLSLQSLSTEAWLMLARRQTGNAARKQLHSKNIIADLPSAPDNPELIIYLVAHYDSKSQSISLPMRIFSLILALGATLVLALELIFRFNKNFLDINLHLCFIIASLAIIRLFIVSTDNKSSGGLDNAGSVGVVLELARVFSQHPLPGIRLKYLFTGAEELGLVGASQYTAEHAGEWEPKSTYFINLDGVGIKGRLALLGQNDPRLAEKLVKMAYGLHIRLKKWWLLPGLLVDHIPFTKRKFPATTLACVAVNSLFIHTRYDTISLVDKAGLQEVGKIIEAWIRNLAYN